MGATLAERALRVAVLGHVPADDPTIIADMQGRIDELFQALTMARECIGYCRRAHKDAQSGEGIPVELFIDAALRGDGTEAAS